MKKFQVELDDGLATSLEKKAAESKVSPSDLLRTFTLEGLGSYKLIRRSTSTDLRFQQLERKIQDCRDRMDQALRYRDEFAKIIEAIDPENRRYLELARTMKATGH
jgi:hypothetical protein